MKKLIFVLFVFVLTACVTQPGPTAYPAAEQALPYPGAAVRSYLDHITAPTVAPAFVAQAIQTGAYPGPWMPYIARDSRPATAVPPTSTPIVTVIPPTKTPTRTQAPPTVTNTAAPPTVTNTPAPPTDTPPPGVLPVIPDGHFENMDWWEYSDAWDTGLIVGSATFEGLTWRPYENSLKMFWGGRDVQDIVSPVGERSLLISDPFEIPIDINSFYFRIYLLLRSEERFCNPPIDRFNVYIGPETFDPNWPISSTADTLIGVMPLCRDNNTWAYTPISVDFDMRAFRGRTVRLKLLVWIDSIDYSHALLDRAEFTFDPPAALQAFSVQDAGTQAPGFLTGEAIEGLHLDWPEMVLPEK